MIEFHFNSGLVLEDVTKYSDWVNRVIESEGFVLGDVDYVFCTDDDLLKLNTEYLNHDTLTDIITFDYTDGKVVSGEIFISTERVLENASLYKVSFENELLRVMGHGLLHLMGYGDKSEDEVMAMRQKEEEKIKLFHVER